MNKKGGIDPKNSYDLESAKKADLITLPEDVEGTNCFNCKYVSIDENQNGYCMHPKVLQPVTKRQCCALWDNVKVERPWKK